jgi:hypothetical protein
MTKHGAQEAFGSEVKVVTELGGEDSWIVEVEAADGDGVIQQDAVVGDVEDGGGEAEALADGAAGRQVEGGVDGEIAALIGANT